MGKRGLVALLSLPSWFLVMDIWLILAVPLVCLQFVIVVFPDHTHFLILNKDSKQKKQDFCLIVEEGFFLVGG